MHAFKRFVRFCACVELSVGHFRRHSCNPGPKKSTCVCTRVRIGVDGVRAHMHTRALAHLRADRVCVLASVFGHARVSSCLEARSCSTRMGVAQRGQGYHAIVANRPRSGP